MYFFLLFSGKIYTLFFAQQQFRDLQKKETYRTHRYLKNTYVVRHIFTSTCCSECTQTRCFYRKVHVIVNSGLKDFPMYITENFSAASGARYFRNQVIFMNQFPPGPRVSHGGHFEILRKFADTFAALYLSPVSLSRAISCSPV